MDVQEIIFCYGEWQPCYERLREKGVIFKEEIPSLDEWEDKINRLCILDDLMSETDQNVTHLFTKGSHHRNISVIQIVQNLFGNYKNQRTISLNAKYLVTFKSPRDKAQILYLGKQMYPGNSHYVTSAYQSATEDPHSYLLFDFTQHCPEFMRLRTRIFPGETQIVYVPSKKQKS